MKTLHGVLFLLTIACLGFRSIQAQNQSGFISLDCGLVPKDLTYVEKTTNITYISDADYTDGGVIGAINGTLKPRFQQHVWALRSFPEGQRNCYNFNLTKNKKYLIRGTFVYGNYDGLNQFPSFDLYIGPNKWTNVSIIGVADGVLHEIIHVLRQDRLQVCLVKTDDTTPFLSSLELRPLNDDSYVAQSGSLMLHERYYFTPNPSFIRYDEDFHDRTWIPFENSTMSSISTDLLVSTSDSYDVPQVIAQTAGVPGNASQALNIDWTLKDITAQSYIYMHFAEIQNLEANETREFNITYNGGQLWFSSFSPQELSVATIYNSRGVISPDGRFNFSFVMTENSTLPPLINGLEIYTVLELLQLDTDPDEVTAMMNIKTIYGLRKKISWHGDPCSPQIYIWEGLNCSYLDSESPRIISLNLTASELTGEITPEISKLTQLRELDLSNNDLSGDIPAFFADMIFLTFINLSGNPKLNSTIPDALQQKMESNSVTLLL